MPIYSYQGRREKTGESVTGMREAQSHAQLGQDLLQEGILLTRYEIKKQKSPGASLFSVLFNRVPVLERLLFARYFALMLRAGLNVKQALVVLAEQTRSKPLKIAIEAVEQSVDRGTSLSDSMMVHSLAGNHRALAGVTASIIGAATKRI
jgi:type IV pilus assembly protein PilC